MISDKSGLPSRLSWVLDETEQSLEWVRQRFNDYTQDKATATLAEALQKSREVLGVLDILDAEGAFMLSRETVLLMDAIYQEQVDDWSEACMACADGLLQLSEYLKHLAEGYADLPVVILPSLNNLRATRGAELLSEHLVFLPQEGTISDEQIGTDRFVDLPLDSQHSTIKRLRYYMQKALLGWYENESPEPHLRTVRKVSANMLVMNRSGRVRNLWWVVGALGQALEQKKLEHKPAVKLLMGRMEREMRRFMEQGEQSYNENLPDELVKNLLYYVALAEPGDGMLNNVKAAYNLDIYLPQGETLSELRQHYTTPGRELWQAVSTSMRGELSELMDKTQSLSEHPNDSTPLLKEINKRTDSLGQALGMLGLGIASNLTVDLANAQKQAIDHPDHMNAALLAQTSDHYIKLEHLLKEYGETGYDRSDEIFTVSGEHVEDRAASQEAMQSLQADIKKVQADIATFYQEGQEPAALEESVKILRKMNGTLEVLDYPEIQPLAQASKYYIQQELISEQRTPEDEEIDTLADIVTLLEAILASIREQQDYLPLLPVGYEKLHKLNESSQLDLLEHIDLLAAEQALDNKKKAQQQNAHNLLQKMRTPISNSG